MFKKLKESMGILQENKKKGTKVKFNPTYENRIQ